MQPKTKEALPAGLTVVTAIEPEGKPSFVYRCMEAKLIVLAQRQNPSA